MSHQVPVDRTNALERAAVEIERMARGQGDGTAAHEGRGSRGLDVIVCPTHGERAVLRRP